ncbi:hypothetical protein GCM10007036_35070 [Alsobacter metallidurans]|uniref:Anti-sigma factor NepR domain-containing protein n=1 Tax=Alsobacter metallidurans TaxID=340221 RepID=A0A917I9R9_9HYPH|nr:NepR family anti-sigma factor [Alsobacter metallidurans]GGH26907.1 hypothetical protein GCM10007036_35070 [Alsobacter metallidurans]
MDEKKHKRRDPTGSSMDQQAGRAAPDAPVAFDADVNAQIGRQLRSIYDSVVSQPVPDRFLELLNQLDSKTGGEKKDEE